MEDNPVVEQAAILNPRPDPLVKYPVKARRIRVRQRHRFSIL
jgi:hypothetical protein